MKSLSWVIIIVVLIVILVLVFSGDKEYNGEDLPVEEIVAVERAVDDLRVSGLISTESEISIKEVEEKDWKDACLGIAEVGDLCAQVITPGYEITLEAESTEFVYRTNEAGSFVVLAEQNS